MRLLWSRSLPAIPLGMSLAREPGTILVWDSEGNLGQYDRTGQRLHRQSAPGSLALAVVADDGHTVAAASKRGRVWMLTAELAPQWERSLPHRPTALAIDQNGWQIAVADDAGGLHLFDRTGSVLWTATTARPLAHLAFVPEADVLVGTAQFGLVCAFDGRGNVLWRDGLVAHVGSLAVRGDGERIVLACFTEGLIGYTGSGVRQASVPRSAAAALAAMSYSGDSVVTVGLERDVKWRDAADEVLAELTLPASPVALAIEAITPEAVMVLTSGEMLRMEQRPAARRVLD